MKVYPSDIDQVIGFSQIKELLAGFCQSHKGAKLANRIKPISRFETVSLWLEQLGEMVSLKSNHRGKVSFEFGDFEEYLLKLKVPGSYIVPSDFHFLKQGAITVFSWQDFFLVNGLSYPQLAALSDRVELDSELVRSIDKVIDDRGEVKDDASPELLQIRRRIEKCERSVRSAITNVLKKAKADELTDPESTLTVRDGRLVIPIKAEHKKRIAGFIHDESATGQTVYLEPGDILELNNEVQELKFQERREVIRILIALSDVIRANMNGLLKGVDLVEKLDFIYAKAKLHELLSCSIPQLVNRPSLCLFNAVHPLLYLAHEEDDKSVVPLSLSLDEKERILIISGPNAGGKSVALKTVGLLQCMLQSGLSVPVHEESKLGFFTSLFVDIGDSQSIEDDLSTYSSHLTSIKYFLSHSNKGTLFLIDEFGKGTEPQFGGAIAESVLLELNKTKSYGIVTTHYQNLKKVGDETTGLVNGAMKYDQEALEPLFELEVGKPGSSFAFEIAKKIGLPQEIIQKARKSLGKSHVSYDKLLNELEKERGKYQKLSKQLEKEKLEMTSARKDYEELRSMVEEDKKRIIKEAKQDAKKIYSDANREVEKTIRQIKESKADKEATKLARVALENKKNKLSTPPQKKTGSLKEGDRVSVLGQESTGVIQKIKGKQAEVLFGAIKSIVSVDMLEKSKEGSNVSYQKKIRKMGIDVSSKMAQFNHELSIRGMRAEEAIGEVESFIDEAILLGADEVRIVHGKGHGILRDLVRTISKDHPSISSIEDEHADRGGAGISVVRLK